MFTLTGLRFVEDVFVTGEIGGSAIHGFWNMFNYRRPMGPHLALMKRATLFGCLGIRIRSCIKFRKTSRESLIFRLDASCRVEPSFKSVSIKKNF